MKTRKHWILAMVVFLTLGLFPGGCGLIMLARNRDNLNKLEVGMTKPKVTQIMGKPYMREASKQIEWWLYKTELPDYQNPDREFTPIVFRDGKLIGWGRNFFETEAKKYEITLKQKD